MPKRKRHQRWTGSTLRLKDNHTWKAPPGHKIVILDRGAARFNYPESWHVEPASDALKLYDVAPPDDNVRLSVSLIHHTPNIDWSELPLDALLQSTLEKSPDDSAQPVTGVERIARKDVEIVWQEISWQDPVEHREARSRVAVARGRTVHAILTLDVWPEDWPRVKAMWLEVMRSLELDRYVKDPTRGDVVH